MASGRKRGAVDKQKNVRANHRAGEWQNKLQELLSRRHGHRKKKCGVGWVVWKENEEAYDAEKRTASSQVESFRNGEKLNGARRGQGREKRSIFQIIIQVL